MPGTTPPELPGTTTTTTPVYDPDGNLTDGSSFHYAWDAEHRLVSAEPLDTASGLKKVTFQYDYLSRRIRKTTSTYTAGAWVLDTTTTFVYDGWNVIQATTTTASGTETDFYVWGLDLSGSLHGAGGVGGLLSTTNSLTGTTRLYTFDATGNVGQLIDSSTGALAAHYEYDAFGNTLVASGPEAENNPIRFSTKWYIPELGWYDYGKRPYDPLTGRWPTRDPIGERGGLNLYGFVENDAINFYDILGLEPCQNNFWTGQNFLKGCQKICQKRNSEVKYCEQKKVVGLSDWEMQYGIEFWWIICTCAEDYEYGCENAERGTFTGSQKDYDRDEKAIIEELLQCGHDVESIPRTDEKTPDFNIDGIPTELKTMHRLDKNTLKNFIEKANKKGYDVQILIDARKVPLSAKDAATEILRAEGNIRGLRNRVSVWTSEGPVAF